MQSVKQGAPRGGRGPLLWAGVAAALFADYAARGRREGAGGARPADAAEDVTRGTEAKGEGDRGRHAESPTQIPRRGWWDILKRTYAEVGDDRLTLNAAGVTFYALLSVVPAIGALVSIYGLFADRATIADHLNGLAGFLPGDVLGLIEEQVTRIASTDQQALGFGFAFGLALSLWSANQAMKAIFDALNVVYDETEKRSFIVLNAISLAFTAGGILLVILAMVLVVALPVVLGFIGLSAVAEWALILVRWPLLLVIVGLCIALLYRFGPSREKAEWRWVTPGSLVATILWIVVSLLFSWYVANFANYNETYGSLGAVIGLITWIWISTTVVLVGGELNAEIEHQTARDTTTAADKPLGQRGARMADEVAPAAGG